MTKIENLPKVAAHAHPEDSRLIFVLRGQDWFWEREALAVTDNAMTADAWNEAHGIRKVEAECMFAGCIFGWDVPAADPDNWNEEGTAVEWPDFPGTAAAIEARKDHPIKFNSYRTAYCGYYDEEWRMAAFLCPECAWIGTYDEMCGPNAFEELMDFRCPQCEKMLLIINYPTYQETLEAAGQGNWFAEYELGVMSGEGEYWEDYKRRVEAHNQPGVIQRYENDQWQDYLRGGKPVTWPVDVERLEPGRYRVKENPVPDRGYGSGDAATAHSFQPFESNRSHTLGGV